MADTDAHITVKDLTLAYGSYIDVKLNLIKSQKVL
jgi:hypothetical protein